MIRNLNPMTFQGFGTILPERGQTVDHSKKVSVLSLGESAVSVCRATVDTWLCNISGMCVLSVSRDNEQFLDFYLDKPVWVQAGVYFSLSAFRGSATAHMAAEVAPEVIPKNIHPTPPAMRQTLRIDQLYTFFYQEKEQGFLFPGEAHPMLELTYVDRGSLHSVADGLDLALQQGDLVLYAPNQWHMQYADIGVAPRFVTISFDASGKDLSSLYDRVITAPQKVVSLLQQMLRELEAPDDASTDMILFLLSQLLLTLCRNLSAPAERPIASHALHSENEIIRRAQQYICTHVREKLSVPVVAKNTDVSPSYLTALFHKHLQIAPGEYIRRIKLQESKQMIREDSMNFTQIAAALHYSTIHHFSRQFKEKFGITPSEYAKSVR